MLAFKSLLGIREIRAFDIDDAATDKLFDNLRGTRGLTLVKSASIQEAVRGADIVTTLTADKNNATILTPDMIEPGMHINAVGGDCPGKTELHPEVVGVARVAVEYEPQRESKVKFNRWRRISGHRIVGACWPASSGVVIAMTRSRYRLGRIRLGRLLDLRYFVIRGGPGAGARIDLLPRQVSIQRFV